jgi:hypothetical protein
VEYIGDIAPYLQIFWNEVGRATIVYSLPVLIVSWLAKKTITYWLDKDTLRYKQLLENETASFRLSLENTANLELEKHKSQLETERLRLQISYGGIFERQANAILEIYNQLLELERNSFNVMESTGVENTKYQENFSESWRTVKDSYIFNRILYPEEIDSAINKFITDINLNVRRLKRYDMQFRSRVSDDEIKHLIENIEKAEEVIERDLPNLKELLISNMRKTLGVVH